MKNLNFRKQVPKNLAINILTFISNVIIGLWLTPYLLQHLGVIAYGLIPLAMFFSQYVGIILTAINQSINRFLLISLQTGEDTEANEIFNTSLVIISILAFIQAMLMAIILFDITFFFDIPDNLIIDAMWLFGLTFIGFSVSLFRSVFGTSLFSYNRLDILRTIDILQNVVRVVVIVILFSYDEPSLKYVGIANLLAALSAILPTLYYFKQFTPQLKINIYLFRKKRVSELSKMSIWVLINMVGVLLLGNIDLYLVNKLIGSQPAGEYAIIVQITTLFRTMAGMLAGVLSPVIMIYYANKEEEKLKRILILVSKLMAIVMVIPLAVAIYFSGDLISIWLGEEFRYLENILSFSLLFLLFSIPVMPLFSVNVSYNKVKLPAILTIIFGLLNILSIYLLITFTDLGLWSVVVTKLIYEFIYNSIFMPIYVSKITKTESKSFLTIPIIAVISFLMVYMSIYSFAHLFNISSFLEIVFFSILLFAFLLPVFLYIFFSKEEKNFVVERYAVKFKK